MSGTHVPYCEADSPRYPSRYRSMLARIEAECRANLDLLRRNKQPVLGISGASLAILLGLAGLLPEVLRADAKEGCAPHAVFTRCVK